MSATQELIDTLGETEALKVMRALGGRHVYFPRTFDRKHPAYAPLDHATAVQLWEHYAGEIVPMPMGEGLERDLRDDRIIAHRRGGAPTGEIAAREKISVRTVQRVIGRYRANKRRHTSHQEPGQHA